MAKNKFYVTTPIYYGTAAPHLGSLYSTLLADVASRWNKLQGKDVFFLTGTDEHGQKIEQAAAKAGMKPKAFVDSFIKDYKNVWSKYQIDYTYFIRTTDDFHIKAVQEWIKALLKKGDIYKDFYEGWYCTPCEAFVIPSNQVSSDAGPLCSTCNRVTVAIAEETYFFKLSAYQDKLLQFYKDHPDFVVPKERLKEVINFVKSGLRDLSISRTTVKWGVPFPNDPKHVAYVWADALNNYITAIGYAQQEKKDAFSYWWPADLQVMGKDILRFHAIYWPAFLMASDLPLPQRLLVHGWIKIDQQKMSKSLGNIVDPLVLYQKYGADPVRYYLVRQMAITHDSEFSIKDLEQRIASDLANDLGNLLNRMVSLAQKHKAQEVSAPESWATAALELRDACWNTIEDYSVCMEDNSYHMALSRLWKFINQVNAYFHAQEPWKLAKDNRDAFLEVLSATCQSLRVIAYLAWPVMPKKMEQLLESIGVKFDLKNNTLEDLDLGHWGKNFMLKKIDTLFVKPEMKKLPEAEQEKPAYIQIDDFTKVELVIGHIEECQPIEKSEKLLKLQVDFGNRGKRQILSGIKKFYTPEELIGKKAVFVFNLKPRKMMGLESQGMILTAQNKDGKPEIIFVSSEIPSGTRLK